jgi:hypothetical protein
MASAHKSIPFPVFSQLPALAIYLVALSIALGVFLAGHQKTALAIVSIAWLVLSAWQYLGGAR